MPFSVDEICRLATVMPGDLIIYKLNQNHSGRILYYSKGMPDFVGVTPEVYAAAVSRGHTTSAGSGGGNCYQSGDW